jgi:hypothetical protein
LASAVVGANQMRRLALDTCDRTNQMSPLLRHESLCSSKISSPPVVSLWRAAVGAGRFVRASQWLPSRSPLAFCWRRGVDGVMRCLAEFVAMPSSLISWFVIADLVSCHHGIPWIQGTAQSRNHGMLSVGKVQDVVGVSSLHLAASGFHCSYPSILFGTRKLDAQKILQRRRRHNHRSTAQRGAQPRWLDKKPDRCLQEPVPGRNPIADLHVACQVLANDVAALWMVARVKRACSPHKRCGRPLDQHPESSHTTSFGFHWSQQSSSMKGRPIFNLGSYPAHLHRCRIAFLRRYRARSFRRLPGSVWTSETVA